MSADMYGSGLRPADNLLSLVLNAELHAVTETTPVDALFCTAYLLCGLPISFHLRGNV